MSYLIRTQIKDYPVEVPVELLVFLCRICIVRISERTDSNKDDPHAINIWTKLIAAVGKILETEEWNGGEVLSHEYVLIMLFIFHSLTWETRLMQLKKLFLTLDHARKTRRRSTASSSLGSPSWQRTCHAYRRDGADPLEEVRHVLLARTITIKVSMDVELLFFIRADNRLVTKLLTERAAATPHRSASLRSSRSSATRERLTSSRVSCTASPTARRPLRSSRNWRRTTAALIRSMGY